MPRGNQLTRQWRLLHLLDRPAGIAVDDAALDLDCAVRTIWRDLRVLHKDALALLDRMRDSIGVRAVGAKLQAPAAHHLAAIQRALLERRRLRLAYHARRPGSSQLMLDKS